MIKVELRFPFFSRLLKKKTMNIKFTGSWTSVDIFSGLKDTDFKLFLEDLRMIIEILSQEEEF